MVIKKINVFWRGDSGYIDLSVVSVYLLRLPYFGE